MTIDASKDGVKFACTGDIGNGAVTLRSHQNVEKPDLNIDIELTEPVSLTFSLKYLVNFCKASALSSQVKICLSNEVPLLVEYEIQGTSWLRFYLAPKVGFLLLSSRKSDLWEGSSTIRIGTILTFHACRLVMRSRRLRAIDHLLHLIMKDFLHGLPALHLAGQSGTRPKAVVSRDKSVMRRERRWSCSWDVVCMLCTYVCIHLETMAAGYCATTMRVLTNDSNIL